MLVALLTAALFLRLVRLDTVPPGMTHDEAAFGAEAEQILTGERPIYFALGYGHEPLYAYAVALAFRLLGHTLTAMRVTSALFGLLAVLSTYLVARRLLPGWAPWLAAAAINTDGTVGDHQDVLQPFGFDRSVGGHARLETRIISVKCDGHFIGHDATGRALHRAWGYVSYVAGILLGGDGIYNDNNTLVELYATDVNLIHFHVDVEV